MKARAYSVLSLRLAAMWLAVAGLVLFSGVFAAGEAEATFGQIPARLLLAAIAGGAFFIVIAFLGSLAILAWPIATTVGYLIQIPRSQPVITFDRIWIGGMLAYILLNRRPHERSAYTRLLSVGLLLLVVSYGLRAISTSPTLSGPVATWVNAILLPAILFVACERYCLLGSDRGRRLAGALMIAGGILGGIGVAQRIWGFDLATVTGGTVRYDAAIDQTRISGPYPVPEPYALSMIVCFAATLYWVQSSQRAGKYGLGIALGGVQAAGIMLTLYRAAWLAAAVVVIASFGIRPGRIGRMFAVAGVAAVLAFVASQQLLQNETVATRTQDTTNISGRFASYEQGLQIFRSAPVFGVGVNRYHAVAELRPPETVAGVESISYAHSSYIGLLAEQGIVGFLPLLVLSYAVFVLVRGLRVVSFSSREAHLLTGTVAGAALGYLIMSLTLTMLPYGPSNAFFAAFLGLASGRLDAILGTAEPELGDT
jgi:O-antigen ligase